MPSSKILAALLAPAIAEFAARVADIVESATLERVRTAIDQAFTAGAREPGKFGAGTAEKAQPTRRRSATSAKQAKARVMQGQYLGLLRGLEGKDRAQVKAVAAKEGVAAAVEAGRRLLQPHRESGSKTA